jgi:hypothetical protein
LGWIGSPPTSRKRPWNVTVGSSDHAAFISSNPSVKLLMNVDFSTPNAENLRKPPPGATPRSSRPWLRRSTAVTVDANCSGSCNDVINTATPSRSRVVHAAAYASSSIGAISGVAPMVCSTVQPPSKPSSSARAK